MDIHAVNNVDVQLIGLNTPGLKSNVPYIRNLVKNYDVIFLSEHWLSNAEKKIFEDITSDRHNIHFSPAEKQPKGRPYGGICFIVNKAAVGKTTIIHEDSNILAIKSTINDKTYVYIGVYLTCYHDNTSIEKYDQQLNTLTSLLKLYRDESEILIIGDLQSFPEKNYENHTRNNEKRNPLSKLLYHFLRLNNLDLYDVIDGSGPTQTYQHKTLPNSSYIDHIIMQNDSPLKYKDCTVHSPSALNTSDHQPVSITIKCNQDCNKQ